MELVELGELGALEVLEGAAPEAEEAVVATKLSTRLASFSLYLHEDGRRIHGLRCDVGGEQHVVRIHVVASGGHLLVHLLLLLLRHGVSNLRNTKEVMREKVK